MEKRKVGFGLSLKAKKGTKVERSAPPPPTVTTPLSKKAPSLYKEVLKESASKSFNSPRHRSRASPKGKNTENDDFHCSFESDEENMSDVSLPLSPLSTEKQILQGVIAFVEVRTNAENRFDGICKQMELLGAVVVKKFIPEVTHVVFKDGKKSTRDKAIKKGIHLVNVLWVESCKQSGKRVSEDLYPVTVNEDMLTPIIPGRFKRTKSMQPRSFEEDLRNSAEKVNRRRRRHETSEKMSPLTTKVLSYNDSPFSPASASPYQSPNLFQSKPALQPNDEQDIESMSVSEKMKLLLSLEKPKQPNQDRHSTSQYMKTPTSPRAAPLDSLQTDSGLRKKRKRTASSKEKTPNNSNNNEENTNTRKKAKTNNKQKADEDKHTEMPRQTNDKKYSSSSKEVGVFAFNEEEDDKYTLESKKSKQNSLASSKNDNVTKEKAGSLSNEADVFVVNDDEDDDEIVSSLMSRCKSRKKSLNELKMEEKADSILKELDIFAFHDEEPEVKTTKMKKRSKSLGAARNTLHSTEKDTKDEIEEFPQQAKVKQTDEIRLRKEHDLQVRDDKVNKNDLSDSGIYLSEVEASSSSKKALTKKRILTKNGKTGNDKTQNIVNDDQTVNVENHLPGTNREGAKTTKCAVKKNGNRKHECDKRTHSNQDETNQNIETDARLPKKGVKKNGNKKEGCNNEESIGRNDATNESDLSPANKSKKVPMGGMKTGNELKRSDRNKEENGTENKEEENEKLFHRDGKEDVIKKTNKDEKKTRSKGDEQKNEIMANKEGEKKQSPSSIKHASLNNRTNNEKNKKKNKKIITSDDEDDDESDEDDVPTLSSDDKDSDDDQGDSDEDDVPTLSSDDKDSDDDQGDSGEDSTSEPETTNNTKYQPLKKNIRTKKASRSLVLTSVYFGNQDVVISVVRKLGGFYVADQVSSDTTHVVSGAPKRTLNALFAIAQGCWLVSPEWAMKSLEAGYWVDEEPYELSDAFPSAQLSRLERANTGPEYRQELFNDVEPIYVCENTSPPTDALVKLITLCGGQVCTSIRKAGVCIGNVNRKVNAIKVSETWIIDSITEHTALPFDSYIL